MEVKMFDENNILKDTLIGGCENIYVDELKGC